MRKGFMTELPMMLIIALVLVVISIAAAIIFRDSISQALDTIKGILFGLPRPP